MRERERHIERRGAKMNKKEWEEKEGERKRERDGE